MAINVKGGDDMKIMAVSDLHGSLEGLDPRGADVVVIAGDLAPMKGWGIRHPHHAHAAANLGERH